MSYKDYIYFLLITPFKQAKQGINHFYTLCKVIGKQFDDCKDAIFKVMESASILTCDGDLLDEHGKDRDMPRFTNESDESYRRRLLSKARVAELAGTNEGIKEILDSLGYDQSYIEPLYLTEPERWAEFMVYLRGSGVSEINDLNIIDAQIMKVKQASALPNYSVAMGNQITVEQTEVVNFVTSPLCGITKCGTVPENRRKTSL